MKTLKYTIAIAVALSASALTQTSDPSQQGGRFIAANYGQWSAQVQSFNPGVACVSPITFTLYNNSSFSPWNINSPILIGFETATPTSFDFISQPGQVCIHALYLQAHFGGDTVKSGTAGLQEALNAAGARGGGIVTLDANWTGTTAIKNAAVIPTNVGIEDVHVGAGISGVGLPSAISSGYSPISTSAGVTYAPLVPSSTPEAFFAWGTGAVAANSCVTNTFSLRSARATSISTTQVFVGDFLAPAWPVNLPANLVGMMRVSSSDVIEIRLCNPTGSATANPGVNLMFGVKIIR